MKRIVVLIGGSGSGKSTVATELELKGFNRLITTTTRQKREGEMNHIHYHFVTEDDFWKIDRVEENQYVGNWYGLSKAEVDSKMKIHDDLIIVMDVNGAISMKKEYGDMVSVVFLTVSPEEMKQRLRSRGGSEAHIQERLKQAHEHNEFTIPEVADVSIYNGKLEKTVNKILIATKKEAY